MSDVSAATRWCFTWDPTADPAAGTSRAALALKNKWPRRSTINVAFLEPADVATVENPIRIVVRTWTAPDTAKLRLVFVKDPAKADLRISFSHPGSWSTIGTSCHAVVKDKPTMNFGWLNKDTNPQELRRVVLHEFGHALGLIHEHQSPATPIPWNKPKVIADLKSGPNNWDDATIQHNMFDAYAKEETNYSKLDTKSIMMYPIPASWVTDTKFVAGLNDDLSPTDRTFIHAQYPA